MEQIRDKKGILGRLPETGRVVLDLGCGPLRRGPDWIGVDRLDYEAVDLVGDVHDVLRAFPGGSVDEVHSSHFFEHVTDFVGLMREIQRVLKKDGTLDVLVPHFSNPYFYSDHTHCRFFGLYSFSYMAADDMMTRKVRDYGEGMEFELVAVKLIFGSPFRVRRAFKMCVGALFNLSSGMQEFYEENLCWAFPCYEIRYTLRRK
jgi:SAM-dependent methyltransferase